ncbi:hypothetical protein M422DRAFT_31079 [Sphaerobolus stellatus SS14]|uniref:Uncharacterized protein n=1 Tax=Sphaerobolus stellatus (strain SS14) TaxID=990650 RepID=A0A0C9VW73_SPHS4|nr:hypothetical protein M422DRAFT_31079 [Sphaerobolus stellatus SS14]
MRNARTRSQGCQAMHGGADSTEKKPVPIYESTLTFAARLRKQREAERAKAPAHQQHQHCLKLVTVASL